LEENVISGGFGESVLRFVTSMDLNTKVVPIAIPNVYVEHGNLDILKKEIYLDKDSIVKKILKYL
jgi:1-deoxy-D-xylulose-5-phosphate synthase